MLICLAQQAPAAESSHPTNQPITIASLRSALSTERWQQIERSVDRGLEYLATQQAQDGSFPTIQSGQPGVTSLCVLAFLSRGYQPGVRPYGQQINRAIDYVVSNQSTNGLLCRAPPELQWQRYEASHTAVYNHAIAGLMLGEVYGQVSGLRAQEVKRAILRALNFSRELQAKAKAPVDQGGWRYLRVKPAEPDSDLSITAWQLMFFRSAKNAEFKVPEVYVGEAMSYVRRCWDGGTGMFQYALTQGGGFGASRGMVGAGILSLSMAGEHHTSMALIAGDWLLAHPFRNFGELIGTYDKFFYSTYYCSQAAAQLGGHYWKGIFPPLAEALLRVQAADGAWPPEPGGGVALFGNALSTALAVLSLTPGDQLLPIYQR